MGGGWLLLLFVVMLFVAYRREKAFEWKWLAWAGLISIPIVWIVSESGWVVAEMGRQPWVIQDLMPTRAAVSAVSSGSVQTTFWIFTVIFTVLLVTEISIMVHEIAKASKNDILK